jgi:hypothetical protein
VIHVDAQNLAKELVDVLGALVGIVARPPSPIPM